MHQSISWALVAVLVSLALLAGCEFGACDDCRRAAPVTLFEDDEATLDMPGLVADQDTFTVTVRAYPTVSGVGWVNLVSQAYMLRTITPVQDSTGCFQSSEPSLCVETSLSTDSARVDFEANRLFEQSWRVVLEEGPMRSDYPSISASVQVDSVRNADGDLYWVHSREAWRIVDARGPIVPGVKSDRTELAFERNWGGGSGD